MLATLIRTIGDFDLAEESLQEALVAALEHWPLDGVPDSPRAWITTTARNRALDRLRREAKRGDWHERAHALLELERAESAEAAAHVAVPGDAAMNKDLWDDDRL